MNSVLSNLRSLADRIGFGAPKIAPVTTVAAKEEPRIMAEILHTNWLGRRTYGRVMVYIPSRGLLAVHPDGSTTGILDFSLVKRDGDDVMFDMIYPLNQKSRPQLVFAGVGKTCVYHHGTISQHTLTELPRDSFEIVEEGYYSYERKYTVIMKK